jgi:hypothetical protein
MKNMFGNTGPSAATEEVGCHRQLVIPTGTYVRLQIPTLSTEIPMGVQKPSPQTRATDLA